MPSWSTRAPPVGRSREPGCVPLEGRAMPRRRAGRHHPWFGASVKSSAIAATLPDRRESGGSGAPNRQELTAHYPVSRTPARAGRDANFRSRGARALRDSAEAAAQSPAPSGAWPGTIQGPLRGTGRPIWQSPDGRSRRRPPLAGFPGGICNSPCVLRITWMRSTAHPGH